MQDIPKSIIPKQPTTEKQAIPRIIWQTFESNAVPPKMYEAAMSWSEYNPEYEYKFSDKDDRVASIANNFAEEVLQAYHLLDNGAFKADLWRYCALYTYGGVYADIDMICKRSLSQLIDRDDRFIIPASFKQGAVFNAFICSAPKHPFLKKAIDRAVKLILAGKLTRLFAVTGPVGLGKSINIALDRDKKHIFEVGQHQENNFSFRILKKIPRKEAIPSVMDGDEIVCLNKYDGYSDDLQTSSVTYWKKSQREKKRKLQKQA
jgi:mannosyltransferase OCH1-like enzyme